MLCSIVIPLYNKEKFILTAIRSVLDQTYQKFEIVVVDDGSTDQGAELIAAIADPRIRIIKQANGGVSRARNRGINEARGELIFFLDADDWYGKKYLETMVLMAQRYPFDTFFAANFKAVYAYRPEEWDAPTTNTTLPTFDLVTNFYERRYRRGPFICTNSVAVWRKDLIQMQPCFPVGESLGEDQDLWFRLVDQLQLAYCPLQLVAYRYDVTGGLCSSNKLQRVPPAFERLEQRAEQGVMQKKDCRYALLITADTRTQVARYLLSTGQRANAIREIIKAYRSCGKKSWWLTLLMCGLGSPTLMQRWHDRRMRRLQIH